MAFDNDNIAELYDRLKDYKFLYLIKGTSNKYGTFNNIEQDIIGRWINTDGNTWQEIEQINSHIIDIGIECLIIFVTFININNGWM